MPDPGGSRSRGVFQHIRVELDQPIGLGIGVEVVLDPQAGAATQAMGVFRLVEQLDDGALQSAGRPAG